MEPHEIRELRLDLGLTREQFAKRLGVHGRTVMRWEQGNHEPTDRHEVALYKILKRRQYKR